jgi:hypothetical protein
MLPFLPSTLELRARNLKNSIQKYALSTQTLALSDWEKGSSINSMAALRNEG